MGDSRKLRVTEVLVAIGVAGLAGALAVPLLGNAGDRAGRSKCLANMKQIGAALTMYSEDYDKYLPRTTEERPKHGFGAHWTYLIQPYVRSEEMFVCPSDPSPAYTYIDEASQKKQVPRLSYINNYAAVPAHDFYPVPTYALTDPGSLIVIGERRSHHPRLGRMPGWKGTSGFVPGQPCEDREFGTDYHRVTLAEAQDQFPTVRSDKQLLIVRLEWAAHGDGSNYTFADGHAAHQPLDRTLDPARFEWGERFYPRSMADAHCDGGLALLKTTNHHGRPLP